MTAFALAFLAAFFVGSIPTAYLFVKFLKGGDIREHGSGNVGATNAARVLGKKLGLLIFAIDFLKGLLPALILSRLVVVEGLGPSELAEFIGFAAILGHIFTPFLNWKGGKGIATGAGVICAGYPLIFACMMGVWAAVLFLTRKTVSIASLAAVGSFIVFSALFKTPISVTLYGAALFLLAIWTHRSNLARLVQGQEIKPPKP